MERREQALDQRSEQAKAHQLKHPRAPGPQFFLPLNAAFSLCFFSHLLAAYVAPIQDCDETFNYWEPLHYLSHQYGLQTWEYSPEFALRSWTYILVHAIPVKLGALSANSKTFEFYLLRAVLAFCCAASETRLYSAVSRALNPRVGIIYLMIVAFSPGMFYASVAFLPSSFAMYTSSFGVAAFLDWYGGPKTASGITWFSIGAIVGWPFSAILVAPFLAEELAMAIISGDAFEVFRNFLDGTVRSLIVLALQTAVDSFFYRQVVVVPWRLVFYNVFAGKDRGPDIFGTEPYHYYIRNLLLNFNLWFILAITVAPLVFLQSRFRQENTMRQTSLRTWIFISPFYIWMVLFTLQPHKEERFMYPAYPFLALNAAIAFHIILGYVGSTHPNELIGKIPAKLKLAVMMSIIALSLNMGLLRIIGTVTAYQAPLHVYQALEAPGMAHPSDTVCFGKDWYRFPSSYFLPNGTRAKFIKSEFSGLLPGEFNEANPGFGLFPGTWLMPLGMNDRNEEDPGKYTSLGHCSYLIDTHLAAAEPSKLEPDYALDEATWERISCAPFLDASRTSTGGNGVNIVCSDVVEPNNLANTIRKHASITHDNVQLTFHPQFQIGDHLAYNGQSFRADELRNAPNSQAHSRAKAQNRRDKNKTLWAIRSMPCKGTSGELLAAGTYLWIGYPM